ncbi:hypothetical protein, partial [Sphingomonas sp. SRS2]|uniref:hypothetical protein n=1 Tax=Sphingomonas sp. SRS2 TaxID=133190 RepID=UPI0006184E9B
MASLASVKEVLASAIPGIRFTSDRRSQAEQDELVRRGKTKARNSQHVSGTGLDMVLPKGFSETDVADALRAVDVRLSESINETGKGKNQGTGAHLHIGWGDKSKGGDQSAGGSTFDRVKAKRDQAGNAAPSIAGVYEAYRSNKMTPNEAAAFENAVNDGAIILPRGAKLKREPAAFQLPKEVIAAYNSRSMADDERAAIDAALADGQASLPKGAKLTVPPARTATELLRMGVRDLSVGMDSLPDIVAGPANALVNTIAGTNLSTTPFRDMAEGRTTNAIAPKPESGAEQVISAANQGAIQGLLTSPLASAVGAETTVGRVLTNPLTDTISGATAGASQEGARQSGAGPVGQLVAGLA